jgi:lipoate---protein ligase
MKRIRLLDLGYVPPVRSQTCYHAAAYALTETSPDTIILVNPSDPYVCVGYHQEIDKEVDREFCRFHDLPVYRREVGGGAVYLDRNQLFSQWIFHPSALPAEVDARYRLYIEPLVQTYKDLGIEATHRPVNDIHVKGKKIGGTGAALIGRAEVLVGSFMFDFDKPTMARVLKVSSEKMRDKVFQGLQDYMTTIKNELDAVPDRSRIIEMYVRRCAGVLGAELVPGTWTAEEEDKAAKLDRFFVSSEWLERKGSFRRPGVRIQEDVQVHESALKAPGGLIRVTVRVKEGRIDDITVSGDFTIYPRTMVAEIEEALRDVPAEPVAVRAVVEERYQAGQVQSPGITPEHWAQAFALALKS